MVLLADPGGTPDRGQPPDRVGGAERQVEAEEGVPVAGLVAGLMRHPVQAHGHLDPDGAEMAVPDFQPSPRPPATTVSTASS